MSGIVLAGSGQTWTMDRSKFLMNLIQSLCPHAVWFTSIGVAFVIGKGQEVTVPHMWSSRQRSWMASAFLGLDEEL